MASKGSRIVSVVHDQRHGGGKKPGHDPGADPNCVPETDPSIHCNDPQQGQDHDWHRPAAVVAVKAEAKHHPAHNRVAALMGVEASEQEQDRQRNCGRIRNIVEGDAAPEQVKGHCCKYDCPNRGGSWSDQITSKPPGSNHPDHPHHRA